MLIAINIYLFFGGVDIYLLNSGYFISLSYKLKQLISSLTYLQNDGIFTGHSSVPSTSPRADSHLHGHFAACPSF